MDLTAEQHLYATRDITSYGVKILWLLFTIFIFCGALIPFDNDQIIEGIRGFH